MSYTQEELEKIQEAAKTIGQITNIVNVQDGKEPEPDILEAQKEHPFAANLLKWFTYAHLPNENARDVSREVTRLVTKIADKVEPGPEATVGFRKLLEAKDCFVRASLEKPKEISEYNAADAARESRKQYEANKDTSPMRQARENMGRQGASEEKKDPLAALEAVLNEEPDEYANGFKRNIFRGTGTDDPIDGEPNAE